MAPDTWFGRIRAMDVRVMAAIAATLMLVIGVMWIVPTTPSSTNFTFDKERRGMKDAQPIELAKPVQGNIVDGSDADFYRIDPLSSSFRLDVHMTNGSEKLIPAVRIFDATRSLVEEKTVEYLRTPGVNVDCSFLAQSHMTYYVQVFSQRNTTGRYTLSVTMRHL